MNDQETTVMPSGITSPREAARDVESSALQSHLAGLEDTQGQLTKRLSMLGERLLPIISPYANEPDDKELADEPQFSSITQRVREAIAQTERHVEFVTALLNRLEV